MHQQLFKRLTLVLFFQIILFSQLRAQDSLIIRQFFNDILTRGKCYSTLDYLSNKIGGRLSGSVQAEQAVQYMYATMKQYTFDTVWLQPVMVPHWERGEKEIGYYLTNGKKIKVDICALGNSVATDKAGTTAAIVEITNMDQLHEYGKAGMLKGKIIFFNRPMNPIYIHTGAAYGDAGSQRTKGPTMAASYGAIGAVVRSLTLALDDHPHTGATNYNDSFPKIPACAISTLDAEQLSKDLKNGPVTFYFKQSCRTLEDKLSYNVIGEIKGSEFPNEVIVVGGHLDAWDNGDGSHDDGAGCVQSVEALRVLSLLSSRPKRTVRCVLFMNEENGLRGGLKYAEWAATNGEKHIAAIESDAGGFTPRGFSTNARGIAFEKMKSYQTLLRQYGIEQITYPGGGADIGPLAKQEVILIGFTPDSQRYFDYHHTSIDTFDKVNKRELELGAGCMAALIWLISEYGLN